MLSTHEGLAWVEKAFGDMCCYAENVVLYDLDRKFDSIRLYHVILTRLRNLGGQQQLR